MAVGEDDRSAADCGSLELGYEGLTPGDDLMEALAPRAAVGEQFPAGVLLVDLGRGQPLVGAIVVLDERVDDRCLHTGHASTGSLGRPLQWTGEDEGEGTLRQRRQYRWQAVGLTQTFFVQRHVSAPGVLPTLRPVGRAVTYQQDHRRAGNCGI